MRKAPYRPLTDEEMKMTDDELMAWMSEQNAKDDAELKADLKEIATAIREIDNETLGRAVKLVLSGCRCECAGKETQTAYDLLRQLYWFIAAALLV